MQIGAAEHLDAQHDGGEGGVGGAAEQTDQAQRAADPRVEAQKAAQHAAEGCADTEGWHNLTALEPCPKGNGCKQHFQQE